jgi:hypothetical protein
VGGGLVVGISDAVDVCLQGEWLGARGFGPMCGVGGTGFVRLLQAALIVAYCPDPATQ